MSLKTVPLQSRLMFFVGMLSFATVSAADTGAEGVPTLQNQTLHDKGIFSDLDADVRVPLPPSLDSKPVSVAVHLGARTFSVLMGGVPVKTYPIVDLQGKLLDASTGDYLVDDVYSKSACPSNAFRISQKSPDGKVPAQGCLLFAESDARELAPYIRNGTRVTVFKDRFEGISDTDADGIPDQVDVLLGAVKTDLDNAEYDDRFYPIAKTSGDVPRKKGCCTDVVIRALRNAGIDLQGLLQRDIQKSPKSYPQIPSPNANIDHRRVRNLLVYFKRHFREIPREDADYMQGDIVLFDTLSKKGPDHIGIVAADRTPDGAPLIINAWTYGAVTDAMDLLSWVPVTHHFRVP